MLGRILIVVFSLLLTLASFADGFEDVQISATKLRSDVYMLQGWGGNMGASIGDDGVFLVDNQLAPLTNKIREAVENLSAGDIRFVINTHWHFDHVGGNEQLAEIGAIIIAHENTYKRIGSVDAVEVMGRQLPPNSERGLPRVTFANDLIFRLNDEEIKVFHLQHAHTDGDAIVWFRHANVMHLGDIYFNGMYPYIDIDAGGSISGLVTVGRKLLSMMNEETMVIPGHGAVAGKAEFEVYITMLEEIKTTVQRSMSKGHSLDKILLAKPTRKFDDQWGDGFIKPDDLVRAVYRNLSGS